LGIAAGRFRTVVNGDDPGTVCEDIQVCKAQPLNSPSLKVVAASAGSTAW
jgi:hypothetical protein